MLILYSMTIPFCMLYANLLLYANPLLYVHPLLYALCSSYVLYLSLILCSVLSWPPPSPTKGDLLRSFFTSFFWNLLYPEQLSEYV